MSNDAKQIAAAKQAKLNAFMGVLAGMGSFAGLSLPRPTFQGIRVRTASPKRNKPGRGEGFDVPDQAEAEWICEELDRKRRAEWMQRHMTTHAERMKAIQAQDIENSRRLVAERRKAARAARRQLKTAS